ncbi:hypothetical protein KK083_09620 [Fulvivirgaceae bacterium PWU4]|uniref:Uncharacterized protein n=1 Tax=Chryseosolibacter histidini TaxID=2782349 RepID=A0AAP2GML8_9BACT|nr:hypothetical protein [Chryseosolibacter histidini]MBT1697133.1 hypothetical protein [Chryseosolibacter histidini]
MRLFITSDANYESKIDTAFDGIYNDEVKELFAVKNYGGSLETISIILTCRDPLLNFKQRIRYSKKEKTLYMDIMFDLEEVVRLSHEDKKKLLAKKLSGEVPEILSRYKYEDFNVKEFLNDFMRWIKKY